MTHLSKVPEGPLEQSLLDQSTSHFDLQQFLRPPPALVGVSGVEDEEHQQIYHLKWQRSLTRDTRTQIWVPTFKMSEFVHTQTLEPFLMTACRTICANGGYS